MVDRIKGEAKYIKMFCPDCGGVLVNSILLVGGGPANEFYVEDLTDMQFHCQDCDTRYYVEEPNIVSDQDFI
ncbi:hypothetical protein U9I18_000105 [Bacillus phage KKP_4048]